MINNKKMIWIVGASILIVGIFVVGAGLWLSYDTVTPRPAITQPAFRPSISVYKEPTPRPAPTTTSIGMSYSDFDNLCGHAPFRTYESASGVTMTTLRRYGPRQTMQKPPGLYPNRIVNTPRPTPNIDPNNLKGCAGIFTFFDDLLESIQD